MDVLRPALIVLVILGCTLTASGEEEVDELAVYCGVVAYNNPVFDSLVQLDFPFSVSRHQFSFFRPDSSDTSLYARIFAQIDLIDSTGIPIDSAATYFSVRVATKTEAGLEDVRVFNKLVMFAAPGKYSARLTVIDVVSKRTGEAFVGEVLATVAEKRELSLSDLALAYDIRYVGDNASAVNERLVKNGFEITPNPISIFSVEDTLIHLYAELYNVAWDETSSPSALKFSFKALTDESRLYRHFGSHTSTKTGKSAVITELFDIRGWPVGGYRLQVEAADIATGKVATAAVRFAIVSTPDLLLALQPVPVRNVYDTLSLEVQAHLAEYFLDPFEKSSLSRLAAQGKKTFLRQFWQEWEISRSQWQPHQGEIIRRYNYANRKFSTNLDRDDGWWTDRGRIYMIYGPWDDDEDVPAPVSGRPYMIWYYYLIRHGVEFVFVDESGGDQYYRLVHSTVEGEIYDQGWHDRLRLPGTERE